jgi:hypothetical protein
MSGQVYEFKRKNIVGTIIGFCFLMAIVPLPWSIMGIVGLISHPEHFPYFIFIIATPIALFLVALCILGMIREIKTVITITEESITINRAGKIKEIKWEDVGDLIRIQQTLNGIQTENALALKNYEGKVLFRFNYQKNNAFRGDGDIKDIILNFYSLHLGQRKDKIKNIVTGKDEIYKPSLAIVLIFSILGAFFIVGLIDSAFEKPSDFIVGIVLAIILGYILLVNLTCKILLSSDGLHYKTIFHRETIDPWNTISHVQDRTWLLFRKIILTTTYGELTLRGVRFIAPTKLANEISMRRHSV